MYLDALNVTHVDDLLHVVIIDQDGSLAPLTQNGVDRPAQHARSARSARKR